MSFTFASYISEAPSHYTALYYRTFALLETYEQNIFTVPHPDDWTIPDAVRNLQVLPPDTVPQSGRPRDSRARHPAESSRARRRTQACQRCGQSGHNSATCTAEQAFDLNSPPEDDGEQRRPKRCGICGQQGHTRRRCPTSRTG